MILRMEMRPILVIAQRLRMMFKLCTNVFIWLRRGLTRLKISTSLSVLLVSYGIMNNCPYVTLPCLNAIFLSYNGLRRILAGLCRHFNRTIMLIIIIIGAGMFGRTLLFGTCIERGLFFSTTCALTSNGRRTMTRN